MVELSSSNQNESSEASVRIELHPAEEAWELMLSAARVTLWRAPAGGMLPSEAGRIDADMLESGIPLSAWNLLRVRIVPTSTPTGTAERLEVFFNPLAQPTAPMLGRVRPRLNVSAPSSGEAPGSARAVSVRHLDGSVLLDYISALPADGGVQEG